MSTTSKSSCPGGEGVPAIRRRFRVAAVALGAGLFVLALGPRIPWLETADRSLFSMLLGASGTPVNELHGTGAHDNPRAIRGAPVEVPASMLPKPRFLAFGDDPEGIFESSPPSPADLAVVLANLHRIGHRGVAVAMPLAWDAPDPIAVATLDHQLAAFDHPILGVPLVRGISPIPLPDAFERLSLPVSRIDGDAGALPIVNQLALSGLRLGGEGARAAFTRLESETPPRFDGGPVPVPLLARWDDRVVISLPLAMLMARSGITAGDLVVIPGREIRVGSRGSIVPIDDHGRTPVMPGAAEPLVIPAEASILREDEQPRRGLEPAAMPLVLRDDRTTTPDREQDYSRHLGDILFALDGAPRADLLTGYPRPHTAVEIGLVCLFAGLSAWLCLLRPGLRHPLFGLAVVLALGLAWAMLERWQVAPPALAMGLTPLAGWIAALGGSGRHAADEATPRTAASGRESSRAARVADDSPAAPGQPASPPPAAAPAEAPGAKRTRARKAAAKKAANKKATAKKSAAKNTTAKKSATGKAATKKTTAKKAAARKTTAKRKTAKKGARKAAAKKQPRKRAGGQPDAGE